MTEKELKKAKEEILSSLVLNEGASIVFGNYTIMSAAECYDYTGDKNFIVTDPWRGHKAFNTINGALNHIERNG